jgi:hypothetical protein
MKRGDGVVLTIEVDRQCFALRVLGNVHFAQRRGDDAFAVHLRAYALQVRTFGARHFETGVLAYRMGCHYEARSEIGKAMYVQ